MGRLKVGDKLEVMVDNVRGTNEKSGAVLTVTQVDGHRGFGVDLFYTTSTLSYGEWSFRLRNIDNGELKLLNNSQTNLGTYTIPTTSMAPLIIQMCGIGGTGRTTFDTKKKCVCGAHKVKDHMHSNWCDLYEPTWKNV